jgi:hypothetical protein
MPRRQEKPSTCFKKRWSTGAQPLRLRLPGPGKGHWAIPPCHRLSVPGKTGQDRKVSRNAPGQVIAFTPVTCGIMGPVFCMGAIFSSCSPFLASSQSATNSSLRNSIQASTSLRLESGKSPWPIEQSTIEKTASFLDTRHECGADDDSANIEMVGILSSVGKDEGNPHFAASSGLSIKGGTRD